jgi:chromosome segregation ATPase
LSDDTDLGKILARLDAIEATARAAHEDLVRVPTLLDRAASTAREFEDERHHRQRDFTESRFQINTERFASMQEVLRKSEAMFSKLHDELAENVQRNVGRADDKVNDLKERLTAFESKMGGRDQSSADLISRGLIILGLLISLGLGAANLLWHAAH